MKVLLLQQRWFIAICILSLLLKILFLSTGDVVNSDGALYIAAAKTCSEHGIANAMRYYPMPFFPLLLSWVHNVMPDWIMAGRLLSVIPLLLILWPLYVLTSLIFNRTSALFTVLLFAVLPVFNEGSTSIMRDPIFLLFFLLSLLCLVNWYQQKQLRSMMFFLLWFVLAVLTRIEGILLLVIVGAAFLSSNINARSSCTLWMRWIAFILLISAVLWGLGSTTAGSALRLTEVMRWVHELVTLKAFDGYQQLLQSLRHLQQASPAADYHNNLFEVARHYAPLIYLIGLLEMWGKAIYPTSLLALIALYWRQDPLPVRRGRWIIGVTAGLFVLMNLIFVIARNFTTERYLWVPIVLTLPWIGCGVGVLWQQRTQRRWLVWILLALVFIMPLSKTVAKAIQEPENTVVVAGQWLHNYDPQRRLEILYDDRRLPLYADRVEDVSHGVGLDQIRDALGRGAVPGLIALYRSNKKNNDIQIDGYEIIRKFPGPENTVLFFRRADCETFRQ